MAISSKTSRARLARDDRARALGASALRRCEPQDKNSSFRVRESGDVLGEFELAFLRLRVPLALEVDPRPGSLIDFDLRHCGNPLHRYHRLGKFDTSPGAFVHLGWVRNAFGLVEDAIGEIFDTYALATEPLFAKCLARMTTAQRARPGSDDVTSDSCCNPKGLRPQRMRQGKLVITKW